MANENEINQNKLVVKEGRTILRLSFNDVKWFKADGNYISIYMQNNRVITCRISLLEILKQLPGMQFVRIHKSYVVNKRFVDEIRSNRILIGDEELPIGRTHAQEALLFFLEQ